MFTKNTLKYIPTDGWRISTMTQAAQAETMGRELGKLRVVFSGNGKMPRREEVGMGTCKKT